MEVKSNVYFVEVASTFYNMLLVHYENIKLEYYDSYKDSRKITMK